jgi:hypothetical protein
VKVEITSEREDSSLGYTIHYKVNVYSGDTLVASGSSSTVQGQNAQDRVSDAAHDALDRLKDFARRAEVEFRRMGLLKERL